MPRVLKFSAISKNSNEMHKKRVVFISILLGYFLRQLVNVYFGLNLFVIQIRFFFIENLTMSPTTRCNSIAVLIKSLLISAEKKIILYFKQTRNIIVCA